MKKYFNFFFITLAFSLLPFSELQASLAPSDMEIESVSIHQFKTPILKAKEYNPVLQIKIDTKGKKNALSLNELSLEILGHDIKNDIESVNIYSTGDKPFLRDGALFNREHKISKHLKIKGNHKLNNGTNYFWVSFQLKEKADLLNRLYAKCDYVLVNSDQIIPETISPAFPQRLGIALRKHMDNNVDTYRIPGLATTNNGTLIAVYDIRRNSATDLQEDIDVGMNRSTDGGKTWEEMRIIMDMEEWGGLPQIENGIGDPSILVDKKTNTIWVAAVWAHGHPGKRNWVASGQGMTPKETSQFVLVKSEDDGKTWSSPINITSQIKSADWHLILQGPGKGITMKDGTLVFPAQFKDENEIPHSTIIYSKDHGETWLIGTGAKTHTTESQVIELDDGTLMLNMRDDRNRKDKSESNGRSVYTTSDLGKSWLKHPTSRGTLQEPTCMGSIIKEDFIVGGKNRSLVLFSNPNSKYRRDHMTIKTSFDDGNSWPVKNQLLLDELTGRGYSCMTKIDDHHIGILYEGSQADLTFQIIPVKALVKSK